LDGDRGAALYNNRPIFFERKYFENRSPQQKIESLSDIQLLASVLQRADAASMHILTCIGTLFQAEYDRSVLLYNISSIPTSGERWNLALDIRNGPKPPLEVRVGYAVEICQAVLYTHAAGLVHKSIRPDNVLRM